RVRISARIRGDACQATGGRLSRVLPPRGRGPAILVSFQRATELWIILNMSKSANLLDQASHFAFGKNWASYSKLVTDERVQEAIASLRRLAGGDLTGKRFLDIGCGSGLHSLAALRLGAEELVAVDIDPDSVATTRNLLQQNAPAQRWSVMERSVFDPQIGSLGTFDVVYSWGVLH